MTTPSDPRYGALEAGLGDLAALCERAGLDTIATELRDERLPALKERRFTLVVLGEFNHGKSSTINALLGRDVLPTGITPTTSVITHIRRGTGPARVVRDNGAEEVAPSALRDFVVHEPPNDLQHVEIEVDSPLLDGGLVVVDTPGVNDISQQKGEITYGYVPRADLVLYVLDATQALKRSEITFIRDRLLRNSLDRVFFALGKADALSPEELAEVEGHVRSRLEELVGSPRLFPISARRALAGGDEGFTALKSAIEQYVRDERDAIVIDGAVRTGVRLATMADQGLAIERGALGLSKEELAKRVEAVRARLQNSRALVSENLGLIDRRVGELKAAVVDEIREFVREFSGALPREIDRARVEDIKRYLPDFILDTFKDFIEGEGEHVAMRLEQLAEEIIAITNRSMREVVEGVQGELGIPARDIDLEVDTFGYDVGVYALGALGVGFLAFSNLLVGGILTLSAPILAFVLKDRVDNVVREKGTEQGLAAIGNAGARIEDEMVKIIDDFGAKLRQFVEDAGDRLYRQVAEALDRAVTERGKVDADTAPALAQIGALREELAGVRARISEVRPKPAAE